MVRCPQCCGELGLRVGGEETGHVMQGELRRSVCATDYPVVHGIPRFGAGARQVGASRCKFVAASVTGLALADAGFDKVACSAVLQHVADAGTVMDELARVCAPRGRMLLGVPNSCMSTAPALALRNLVNRFERRGLRAGRDLPHAPDQARSICSGGGRALGAKDRFEYMVGAGEA